MIRELFHQIGRLFTWLVLVAPWEQAMRVRLGSRVTLLEPGVYLCIPFIDRVFRQSVRRRLSAVPFLALTTRDGKPVSVSAFVGYTIRDLRTLYDTLDQAEDTIEAMAAGSVAAFVTRHDLAACTVEALEAHVRATLKLERFGLGDTEFFVSNFHAARTMRLITGEPRTWNRGEHALTTSETKGAA